jgi:hypothetical protein
VCWRKCMASVCGSAVSGVGSVRQVWDVCCVMQHKLPSVLRAVPQLLWYQGLQSALHHCCGHWLSCVSGSW